MGRLNVLAIHLAVRLLLLLLWVMRMLLGLVMAQGPCDRRCMQQVLLVVAIVG